MMSLFLLQEINKKEDSIFYYYLRSLPVQKIPALYEYATLDLFKNYTLFKKVIDEMSHIKKSYNDLRRLVFSHGLEVKDNFTGSFLLGDYIWAK